MNIQGLQKLTLLDYPEKTACTVFTGGCNFSCPFCHNAELVLDAHKWDSLTCEELDEFLIKRKNVLDGVCVTGGEPFMQRDLEVLLARIKSHGYLIKLDTNGSFPERLRAAIEAGLVDYVAMDIKNSRAKYAETTGTHALLLRPVEDSVSYLLGKPVAYEFRTTVVREFHQAADFAEIAEWISGAEKYYLQAFVDSGQLIRQGLTACTADEMKAFLAIVRRRIPSAQLRGLDA